MNTDLNELAKEIHEWNVKVGWWDEDENGKEPCIYEKLQLVSTEIAEATEGERKDLMDDHLPHRKMAEVELADALIRVLDVGAKLNLYYEIWYIQHFFVAKTSSIAKQHLGINCSLTELSSKLGYDKLRSCGHYSSLINSILKTAEYCGYDIYGTMEEKLEYNKNRADHKRENRSKVGGKKF